MRTPISTGLDILDDVLQLALPRTYWPTFSGLSWSGFGLKGYTLLQQGGELGGGVRRRPKKYDVHKIFTFPHLNTERPRLEPLRSTDLEYASWWFWTVDHFWTILKSRAIGAGKGQLEDIIQNVQTC